MIRYIINAKNNNHSCNVSDTMIDEKIVLSRMNYLRGLLAVLIVIGHCSVAYTKEVMPWYLVHKSNMISVAFFFVVSGWGLSYNYYNKESYLNGFLKRKVLKLFIMAIICQIIMEILRQIILNRGFWFNIQIISGFNWYIYEMLLFYFVFFMAYSLIKKPVNRLIAIWVGSLLICVCFWWMCNYFSLTHSYHFSTLGFAWGISIHENYKLLVQNVKHRMIANTVLTIVAILSCYSLFLPKGSFIGGVLLHNLAGISCISLIVVGAFYHDYRRIPIIGWLTKYSAEIYLYQFIIIEVTSRLFENLGLDINYIFILAVLLVTVISAVLMNRVNKVLLRPFA